MIQLKRRSHTPISPAQRLGAGVLAWEKVTFTMEANLMCEAKISPQQQHNIMQEWQVS
ncbi:MAG: hypothetical protein ACI8ZV_001896 [Chitinophagales bacterium]|jgi:hypothetical protein